MNIGAAQALQRHRYYQIGRRLASWVRVERIVYRRTGHVPADLRRVTVNCRNQLERQARIR